MEDEEFWTFGPDDEDPEVLEILDYMAMMTDSFFPRFLQRHDNHRFVFPDPRFSHMHKGWRVPTWDAAPAENWGSDLFREDD